MHAGLSFGDGAVVGLDLSGTALDEDALRGFAACGNEDALGDGGVGVAHGDGNFRGGVAGVGEIDSDEPAVGIRPRVLACPEAQETPVDAQSVPEFGGGGKDTVDGDVGQALIGIDPIGEEPGEIAAQAGLLDELFEVAGACRSLAPRPCRGVLGRASRRARRRRARDRRRDRAASRKRRSPWCGSRRARWPGRAAGRGFRRGWEARSARARCGRIRALRALSGGPTVFRARGFP